MHQNAGENRDSDETLMKLQSVEPATLLLHPAAIQPKFGEGFLIGR